MQRFHTARFPLQLRSTAPGRVGQDSCPPSPIRLLLSAFSYPPSPIRLLLSAFSYPPSPARLLLSAFSYPPSPIRLLLSAFSYPPSPIRLLLSAFSYPPSPIRLLLSAFSYPPSPIRLLLPAFSYPPSPIRLLLSAFSFPIFERTSVRRSFVSSSVRLSILPSLHPVRRARHQAATRQQSSSIPIKRCSRPASQPASAVAASITPIVAHTAMDAYYTTCNSRLTGWAAICVPIVTYCAVIWAPLTGSPFWTIGRTKKSRQILRPDQSGNACPADPAIFASSAWV